MQGRKREGAVASHHWGSRRGAFGSCQRRLGDTSSSGSRRRRASGAWAAGRARPDCSATCTRRGRDSQATAEDLSIGSEEHGRRLKQRREVAGCGVEVTCGHCEDRCEEARPVPLWLMCSASTNRSSHAHPPPPLQLYRPGSNCPSTRRGCGSDATPLLPRWTICRLFNPARDGSLRSPRHSPNPRTRSRGKPEATDTTPSSVSRWHPSKRSTVSDAASGHKLGSARVEASAAAATSSCEAERGSGELGAAGCRSARRLASSTERQPAIARRLRPPSERSGSKSDTLRDGEGGASA